MLRTIVLIKLGLGLCLPGLAQNNLLEPHGPSLTGTNAIQDYVSKPAEIPTLTIKPGDVVQESIECERDTIKEDIIRNGWQIALPPNYPTNAFRVRWMYTDEAAKHVRAFREKNASQIMRTVIGSFSKTPTDIPVRLRIFDAEEMKRRWLAKPVDSISGLTEEQAKQMVADLRNK